jgi:hypothetical protein
MTPSSATAAPFAALSALDALEASFDQQAWFSTLGEAPTDAEAAEVRCYLDGLALAGIESRWLTDLAEARDIARRTDWDRGWADAEQAAVAALTETVDANVGKGRATDRLNRLMSHLSTVVTGPAATAAARFGLADPGLNRAMAGAATHAAFERALVAAADAPREHPLAAKYRLFAGGRWPLAVVAGSFFIF